MPKSLRQGQLEWDGKGSDIEGPAKQSPLGHPQWLDIPLLRCATAHLITQNLQQITTFPHSCRLDMHKIWKGRRRAVALLLIVWWLEQQRHGLMHGAFLMGSGYSRPWKAPHLGRWDQQMDT